MSVNSTIVFVFENAFPDVFNYDAKYDEMTFKVKTFNVKQYPINLRNIWYKFYPQLLENYKKLGKVYNNQNLMIDIETDNLLEYIPNKLIDSSEIPNREFHKLLENDYRFLHLKTRADRKHFLCLKAVRYNIPELGIKGWNINYYLSKGLMKIKDIYFGWDVVDFKYLIQFMNKTEIISPIPLKRFTNSDNSELIIPEPNGEIPKLNEDLVGHIANNIITHLPHENKLTDLKLLHLSLYENFDKFDLKNDDIATYIINCLIDNYNKPQSNYINEATYKSTIERIKSVAKNLLPAIISRKFTDDKIFKLLFKEPWFSNLENSKETIFDLILLNQNETDVILDKFQISSYWFDRCIKKKLINSFNFKELWDKYSPSIQTDYWIPEYCGSWIETYHEEPPLEIYVSPNTTCSSRNMNCSQIWAKYVNSSTVPKEMISLTYYNYMIQFKGKKRNPNHTVMWTFFSNSDENKIIFCRSDVELLKPARARYNIAIDFDKLKTFLHEEVETNGVCLFTHLTADDWIKITGGRSDFDCVVFSDMKNIFRERTPLKQVIQLLNDSIALQFDVEPEEVK